MAFQKTDFSKPINKVFSLLYFVLFILCGVLFFVPTFTFDVPNESTTFGSFYERLEKSIEFIKSTFESDVKPFDVMVDLLSAAIVIILAVILAFVMIIGLVKNIKALIKSDRFANNGIFGAIAVYAAFYVFTVLLYREYFFGSENSIGNYPAAFVFMFLGLIVVYMALNTIVGAFFFKRSLKIRTVSVLHSVVQAAYVVTFVLFITYGFGITGDTILGTKHFQPVGLFETIIQSNGGVPEALLSGFAICFISIAFILGISVVALPLMNTVISKKQPKMGINHIALHDVPLFDIISLIFSGLATVCIAFLPKFLNSESDPENIGEALESMFGGAVFSVSNEGYIYIGIMFVLSVIEIILLATVKNDLHYVNPKISQVYVS